MHCDPLSDFLTRIRNAQMAQHKVVDIPASNLKKEVTKILFDQGYILNYKFVDAKPQESSKLHYVTILKLVDQLLLSLRDYLSLVFVGMELLLSYQEYLTVLA